MAVPATAEQMTATAGQRMRAIVQTEYGTADVLRVAEIERPVIGADEVLVKVRAAGVDRGTWHLMAGMPYAARLVSVCVHRRIRFLVSTWRVWWLRSAVK